MSSTQNAQILAHLKSGKSITSLEALVEFGCMRLPSRICELKQKGHPITGEMIELPSGKHVKQYRLERAET